MSGYDGTIRIDTSLDGKGFNSGISGMMGSLKGLAAAIGIAFGVGAVVAFGKSAVDAAANVEEMRSKFAVVFKGLASDVEAQLGDFAKAANQSKNELMGFAATIQDTFVPLGFARDKAADMSVEVVKLATDLSSFNNIPVAQAIADIQSALVGQSETVRKYGVVLNETNLKQEAMRLGLSNGIGVLDANARAAAALSLIQRGSADAMGDAIRTSGSYTNRMRGLAASFGDLKVAIGDSIIPIINQILPYIKAAVDALVIFFNTVAQVMNALFGTNVSMASVAAEMETASGGMSEVADSSGAAADAQKDLAKNTEKAGKAAKGALAAFDELNVLQQPDAGATDTGGSGGGGGASSPAAGGGALALPSVEDTALGQGLTALQEKVDAFKIKFLEFIQPVVDALGRLKESLAPLGETIWAGLKWAWDNILVPLGAWAITELLPAFLDLIGGAAELLNSVLIALQPTWDIFWENVLKPLAEWTGGAIVDFLGLLADGLKGLSDWIDTHMEGVQTFITVISGLALALWALNAAVGGINIAIGIYNSLMLIFAGVTWAALAPYLLIAALIIAIGVLVYLLITYWEELSTTVKQLGFIIAFFFTQAWEKFKKWLADLWTGITQFAADTVQSIQDKWASIGEWFTANVITPLKNIFAPMWDFIKILAWDAWLVISYAWSIAAEWFRVTVSEPIQTKFNSIWESIKNFAFNAWEYIKTTWKNALAWFTTNVTLPLQNIFQKVWETIKTYAANAWQYITDKFKSMATWAQTNIVDPIKNGFQSALDFIDRLWRNVFNGIVGFTKGVINNIIDAINGMLSGMTSGMNSMIETANNVGSTLPGWVMIPEFTAPYIPRLATGAVIPPNAEFLAVLGDQTRGRNIETPEALMRQIVREESGSGGGGEIVIRFEGSLSALVKELKPYIDRENNRMGANLIISGAL